MPDKPDFVFVQHVVRYIGDISKEERKLSAKTYEGDSKSRRSSSLEFRGRTLNAEILPLCGDRVYSLSTLLYTYMFYYSIAQNSF